MDGWLSRWIRIAQRCCKNLGGFLFTEAIINGHFKAVNSMALFSNHRDPRMAQCKFGHTPVSTSESSAIAPPSSCLLPSPLIANMLYLDPLTVQCEPSLSLQSRSDGHTRSITSVDFSSDGQHIVSGWIRRGDRASLVGPGRAGASLQWSHRWNHLGCLF